MSRAGHLLAGLACVALLGAGAGACAAGAPDEELGSGGTSGGTATTTTTSTGTTTTTGSGTGSSTGSGGNGGASTTGSGGSGGTGGASTTGTGGDGGAGGSGGSGGATGSGGDGGDGGAAGAGGAGGEAGSGGGGGAPAGTVVMFAGGGASEMLAGVFHPGSSWKTSKPIGGIESGVGLAMTSGSTAVGVLRAKKTGQLQFATWEQGSWDGPAAVDPLVTTRDAPAIAAAGGKAHVVFQGDDYKHYYAAYAGALPWSPKAEPVGGGGASQSYGPSAASLAVSKGDVVVAFAGNDHDVFDQTRSGGVWQPAKPHGLGDVTLVTPAIAALESGPELLIVFVQKDTQVLWTGRTAGAWSAPKVIANALTSEPVSLVSIPGGALTAFRGTDGKVYWCRYSAAKDAWSLPSGIANPNYATPSRPALASGPEDSDGEMLFVDAASGAVFHARLVQQAWTAPAMVGGSGLAYVSAAAAP